MRIAIAEDDPLLARYLGRFYCQSHQVEVVGTGVELLRILDVGVLPDLVITDNNMPVMTGIDALRKLRADKRYDGLPIIVHSSDRNPGVRTEIEKWPKTALVRKSAGSINEIKDIAMERFGIDV